MSSKKPPKHLIAILLIAITSLTYWLIHEEYFALYVIPVATLVAITTMAQPNKSAMQITMHSINYILAMVIIIYPSASILLVLAPVLYALGAIIASLIDERGESRDEKGIKTWQAFLLVLIIGIAGIYYKTLHVYQLQDTAALYIGLPFLLALGITLLPQSKSVLIATLKGITIALLLSSLVFQEGYVCILMSAPIFYIVGGVISYAIDTIRKRKNIKSTLNASIIATIFGLLSLEGVTSLTTFPRDNTVTVTKIVPAGIDAVRTQLAKKIELSQSRPLFLYIFPYPTEITGQGLQIGDTRTARFVAYKHIWWTKVEGSLIMKVTQSNSNNIKFSIVKDDSYLSHYLSWQDSEVLLTPVDANHTRVTWILSYNRKLDPAWYFSPMQHYAATLAADELIDHAATPHA